MASPFLAIGSGLTQGLASGIQAGANLVTQQRQMALQQQQADAANLAAFSNALKIPDPSIRDLALNRLMKPALGVDPTSDIGKQTLATIKKTNDENLAALSAALPGMPKAAIYAIMSDPAQMANMLYKISTTKAMGEIVQQIGTPDANGNIIPPTQPAGTGDMGTGTAGAGGTVVAPVADAGTSAVSPQPAVSPAPASTPTTVVTPTGGSATPPASAAAPTTPSSATAPATTEAPQAAPIQGGTAPVGADTSIVVGKDPTGNPVKWDPYQTPYVKGLNLAMDRLASVPDSEHVIGMLKDKRDQFIAEQKTMYTQFMDMQHLALEKGNLNVSQYRASLEARGLALQGDKFEYQKKHDKDLLDYSKYKDAIDQAVAERRITQEEATGKLAQKRYELEVTKFETEPRSAAGQTLWDQEHHLLPGQNPADAMIPSSSTAPAPTPGGTALSTAGQKTMPIPPPAYIGTRDPSTLGKTEANGTITITDMAVLKSVGALNDADRLIYNPATKSWFIQVPTNTTAFTKEGLTAAQEGLDNAQLGVNAVDAVTDIATKDMSALGNLGRLKGTVQGVTSQLQDLAKSVPLLAPLIDAVGANKFGYDPNVSVLDGLEQAIKSKVAKALTDTGAGLGSYAIGVKSVDELVDLRHIGRKDILAHMQIVKQILSDARDMNLAHLPTGSKASVATQPTITAQPVEPSPDAQKKAQETPLQLRHDAWQQMSAEQRKAKQGTVEDMSDSNFPVAPDGTSHLTKIPIGQIKQLIKSLNQYKNDPNGQAQVKAIFNQYFGNPSKTSPGASALVGYP